jgi:cob(I)alamin adenosyltransferase
MAIYTKTGDAGTTSLFGGVRVSKSSDLVDAYGSVDELNSWVGLIVAEIDQPQKKDLLVKIQSDLFMIGGNLAGWKTELAEIKTRVTEIEVDIDAMELSLAELNHFILPGGTVLASHVHIARSVCRRVERIIVSLIDQKVLEREEKTLIIIQYLNRLSDLFFVLSRFINNAHGVVDIPWKGIS